MAGEKLPKAETDRRIQKCFDLRFKSNDPIRQDKWIEYCHENYGDKSELQYSQYWIRANERYNNGWKARLENLLDPAIDELTRLLADEDPKVRQRAIDQIAKFTGNDIQKIQADIKGQVNIKFGSDE